MSPSGRLYLLTIVGLILPTRGQRSEEATSISLADSTTVNIHALTQTPDAVHPELPSTPQTSTLQAGVETPTQTQQLKGETVLLTTDPGTDESSTEGTTLSKQSPDKDFATDPAHRPTDSSEDDPFSYGGKCRQLPRLCRKHNRAYRVTKAQPEREDPDGARARADGLNPLPSQPCLP
ncbi:FXYD domain-containing ion transport regulator 5 isoform X5 [Myotis lucifugus]|uniref:FXYD domain-containing ion transport regulator 5 isoform X5 n=1 Tax=Myotis lucifugus TaxID=59463 RepID=UPI000CCC46F1|nr:FXYD domain-containing ion transport regulator 5 isoform X5 [Myotis lucifugus]